MKSDYKRKNILITGGLGFIGSSLAIRLVRDGALVMIVDAIIPEYGGNLFNIDPIKNKVKFIKGDVRDRDLVDRVVKGQDIIFNLAGTLSHVDSMRDPMIDLEINCRAQLSLLESVRKYNPKARIIFAGTRNQYGKAQFLPVTEDHPMEPTDINGINNIAAEKYHLMYTSVYSIPTISLRMTNTYGPRHQMKHPRQGVLNWFIRQVMDRQTVVLYGSGRQVRDVNFVDDVVEALLIVGKSKKGWGEAYNLGGVPVSLEDFVKILIEIYFDKQYNAIFSKTGPIYIKIPFPEDRKDIEIGDYIADYSKMTKTFGWKPKVSLDCGIRETIDYYAKYKDKYW